MSHLDKSKNLWLYGILCLISRKKEACLVNYFGLRRFDTCRIRTLDVIFCIDKIIYVEVIH